MATKPDPSKPSPAGKGARAGIHAPRRTTKSDRLVRFLKANAGREIVAPGFVVRVRRWAVVPCRSSAR